jgi:hypothetical protein
MGYPTLGAFALCRAEAGASLAAISREAGLHKDWLARHLNRVDPAAAAAVRGFGTSPWDARWLPAVTALGFADVAGYLRDRHLARHQTVNAISAEISLSHHAVESALRRHNLTRTSHASKRHAAQQRAAVVAAALGAGSVPDYVALRRAAGWTWQAIAAESGQPSSWLRRQAAAAAAAAGTHS